MIDTQPPIAVGRLALAPDRLHELDAAGRPPLTVYRSDVRAARVGHGWVAPRPLVQAVVGGVLLGALYVPVKWLVDWLRFGGTFLLDAGWLLPVGLVGGWMLATAFRRGCFVELDTVQGRRRMVLRGLSGSGEVRDFGTLIGQTWGMPVRVEV